MRCAALDGGAAELDAIAGHTARQRGADFPLDLLDEAAHRGECYPWTAARVPMLADLAVDERITDYHRSAVLLGLYAIATADRTRPAGPTPDAEAARAAVAGELPRLAARRGDSELYGYLGAALAAACPEAGAWPVGELEELARRWKGTSRGPAAALILGLGTSDAAAVEAALAEVTPAEPGPAVAVLQQLLEPELTKAEAAFR